MDVRIPILSSLGPLPKGENKMERRDNRKGEREEDGIEEGERK